MTNLKLLSCIIFVSFSALVVGARTVTLGPLPVARTEVSRSYAFNSPRRDVREMSVRLEVASSVSNSLQVAFGTDTDGDGELAQEEEELLLGWGAGRYILAHAPKSLRVLSETVSLTNAARFLEMRIRMDAAFKPSTAMFTTESGAVFPDLSAEPPDWFFNPAWNIVRVTRRGTDAPQEWCRIDCDYNSFVITIR